MLIVLLYSIMVHETRQELCQEKIIFMSIGSCVIHSIIFFDDQPDLEKNSPSALLVLMMACQTKTWHDPSGKRIFSQIISIRGTL